MAPEQALGRDEAIGPATDVYALGGILYYLLTGRAPFISPSLTETLQAVVEKPPVPPRQHNPQVPAELEAICLKCLQKVPADRYFSALALAEALRQYARGTTAPSGRRLPWLRWGPESRFVAAAVLVVMAAGFGWWVVGGGWQVFPSPVTRHPSPTTHHSDPPVGDLDEIVPAKPTRQDFSLKVELVGSTPGPNGLCQLVNHQQLAVRLKVDVDAYVGVWAINAHGTVLQLFPNKYEPDNLVRAGQVRLVPGLDREDYSLAVERSAGAGRVWAVALTSPWKPRPGKQEGPWTVFRTAQEREELKRDIIIKTVKPRPDVGNKAGLSEEIITYRVNPAKQGD